MLSAEYDLDIRPGNKAAATRNAQRLTLAQEAAYPGGTFPFRNRKPGPILEEIGFDGKPYYFNCGNYALRTGVRSGIRVKGAGGSSTPLPTDFFGVGPTVGGCETIFIRLDPLVGGPFWLVRNQNFKLTDVMIYGQDYATNVVGATPYVNNSPIGFEIEGHAAPPTGESHFNDVSICFCNKGVVYRNGYYNNGFQFVEDENHADNNHFGRMKFWNNLVCIESLNQQAINNVYDDIHIGWLRETPDMIFLNCERGGNNWVKHLKIDYPKICLQQVKDYSHTQAQFTVDNFKWDGLQSGSEEWYLTLFRYAGPLDTDMNWRKFTVRVTGYIAEYDGTNYNESKLIEIPTGRNFNVSDMLFDIRNLPTGNFNKLGSGPWYTPKQV